MANATGSRTEEVADPVDEEPSHAELFRYRLALGSAVLLGAVLAFLNSGRAPFWRDEAYSATIANRSLLGTLHVLRVREANMGLYYLLLNLWERIGGTGESWIRAFSAVAALAAIWVTALVAQRLVNRPFAVVTAFLLATNPWFVIYAREARAYGLTLLLTTTATLLFLRALERPSAGRYAAYGIALAGAEYSQLLAVLVVIPHIAYLIHTGRHRDRAWVLTYVLAGLSFLPLAATVFASRHNDQVSWIPRLSVHQVGGFAESIVGGPVAFFVVLVLTLVLFGEAWRRRDRLAGVSAYLALGVLAPVLVVALVSIVAPLFVGRYLLFVLPALTMLTAAGLVRLHALSRWTAWGVALILLGCVAVADHANITERFKNEDIPAAVAFVRADVQPGDALVYEPAFSRVGFEWYAGVGRAAGAADVLLAPEGTGRRVGDVLSREVSAQELDRRLAGRHRLWVVGYPTETWTPSPEPAKIWMATHRDRLDRIRTGNFGDISVTVYQLRTS